MTRWCVTLIVLFLVRPACAQPADTIDRPVTITVAGTAGGGIDLFARLLARHMGRHIPGHPTIAVQTMPGAGSLRAANYLYNVAPKDGTGLGVVSQTVMLEEPFQTPGVQYKANEFTYVGRMTAVLETMI